MKPWYLKKRTEYESQKSILARSFPSLHFSEEKGTLFIRGSIGVGGSFADTYIDRDFYQIEIKFPADYPESLPIVKEVSGAIKRVAAARKIANLRDLHINSYREICLCARPLERRYFPKGAGIDVFLNNLVIPYFYNLSYFLRTGRFSGGDYSHAGKGLKEFYSDEFGLKGDQQIRIAVEYLAKNSEIKGHWLCPCGSNKKIKDCCRHLLDKLREFKCDYAINSAKKDLKDLDSI